MSRHHGKNELHRIYQRGYLAGQNALGRDASPYRGREGAAWLSGWHEARCASARIRGEPKPLPPDEVKDVA